MTPPAARGFGTVILETVAVGYFAGRSRMAFLEAGVAFAVEGAAD